MKNQFTRLLFLFIFTSVGLKAQAQILPLRDVSLEWESIDAAAGYDIEVAERTPKAPPKATKFSTREPIWKGRLSPGDYQMRVRSKDRRQVPGDWSAWMEMTVLLSPPSSKDLQPKQKLQSKRPENLDYLFRWDPVPGAESYQLKVEGPGGDLIHDVEIKKTETELTLPVAKNLKWTLSAKNSGGLVSESPLQGEMEIWGPQLTKTEIMAPENAFVRELRWKRSPYAEGVDYSLQRRDPETKKWITVENKKNTPDERLSVPLSWPGGVYRLSLRANAPLRKTSKVTSLSFRLHNGDRSEEAEYEATLRQSITRPAGWFFMASYLVTGMNYKGQNADNGGSALLQVDMPNNFGGTGRLGLGYLSDRKPWGFLTIADLSGFTVANQNPTFASLEANAIYRMVVGRNGEFRQQMGLFYKEIPEIIARNLESIDRIDKIVAAGPHYGFEYWWALTPTIGFQVNAHLYASSFSIKTPTGNPVSQSLSYQAGLLGSYRLNSRVSGLLGYALRKDSQAYQSTGTRINSVEINGHYLNLLLEWAL